MASLSAQVDQRLQAYAKRPRRMWISASTRQHAYAAYMEAWRAKVERIGNLNYPDKARRERLMDLDRKKEQEAWLSAQRANAVDAQARATDVR